VQNNPGPYCSARVIMDRETGRSRGFGFVTYTSTEEAAAAITGMDGKVCFHVLQVQLHLIYHSSEVICRCVISHIVKYLRMC
jgi:RNA recognition motif-containing protein